MRTSKITAIEINNILELYTCCTNKNIDLIAETLGYSKYKVNKITSDYLSKKIIYNKPKNLLILHSSINTDTNE